METPLITITIPVYNTERYLRRCIDSVLFQTFQDFEIIIVDDCSQDKSSIIISEYVSKDKRIKIIRHENNLGLMRARETGYKNATGTYILFLDSDDSLPQTALEVLFNEAQKTHSEIIAGQIAYIIDNKIKYDAYPCFLPYGKSQKGIIHAILDWKFTHNLCGKLFSRSIFSNYTYITFDNCTIGEDGFLFYQIIENTNSISTIPKVVYNYYRNIGSSTLVKYSNNKLKSFLFFFEFRYSFIMKHNILEKEIKNRTLKDLCIICGQGHSFKDINMMLKHTAIPFNIGFKNIVYNMHFKEIFGCLAKVYFIGPFRMLISKLYNKHENSTN